MKNNQENKEIAKIIKEKFKGFPCPYIDRRLFPGFYCILEPLSKQECLMCLKAKRKMAKELYDFLGYRLFTMQKKRR